MGDTALWLMKAKQNDIRIRYCCGFFGNDHALDLDMAPHA